MPQTIATCADQQPMTCANQSEHYALFYSGLEEFAIQLREFIELGLERGEPVLVAVRGAKHGRLLAALNGSASRVELIDMERLGRNPGRIIPAVRAWVDGQGRRCRFVGEPIWPGRSGAETIEATRHEALINLAFADADVTIRR